MWCMFTAASPAKKFARARCLPLLLFHSRYSCLREGAGTEQDLLPSGGAEFPRLQSFVQSARSGVGLARRQGTLCRAAKMTENIAVFLLIEAGTSAQQGQLATGSSVSSRNFDRDRSDARQNRTPALSIERAYSSADCARSRFARSGSACREI